MAMEVGVIASTVLDTEAPKCVSVSSVPDRAGRGKGDGTAPLNRELPSCTAPRLRRLRCLHTAVLRKTLS